jgi:hypothetical protein
MVMMRSSLTCSPGNAKGIKNKNLMNKETHLIFSDESGYCGRHRYGAIGAISGSKSNTKNLNTVLQSVLNKYSKSELKFSEVTGHSSTMKAAKEFINLGMQYCHEGRIKIHIIVWDTKDSRHQIQGRNDIENMKRMYYHILKRTKSNWKGVKNWEFYPDEFSAIDWQNDLVQYLEKTNLDKSKNTNEETLFSILSNFRFPFVRKQGELQSEQYPILQLSDLFVGLVRLSYECGNKYSVWLSNEENKASLFPQLISCNASKNEKYKFQIMKHFKDTCSRYKLGVNFSRNRYFITFHDRNGIVIWFYKPQGEYDKAPTIK